MEGLTVDRKELQKKPGKAARSRGIKTHRVGDAAAALTRAMATERNAVRRVVIIPPPERLSVPVARLKPAGFAEDNFAIVYMSMC